MENNIKGKWSLNIETWACFWGLRLVLLIFDIFRRLFCCWDFFKTCSFFLFAFWLHLLLFLKRIQILFSFNEVLRIVKWWKVLTIICLPSKIEKWRIEVRDVVRHIGRQWRLWMRNIFGNLSFLFFLMSKSTACSKFALTYLKKTTYLLHKTYRRQSYNCLNIGIEGGKCSGLRSFVDSTILGKEWNKKA